MIKVILQVQEKILRKKSSEVPVREITKPKIKKILKEMSQALSSQSDGVAIAAPQIGYSLRIFVVSGKIFNTDYVDPKGRKRGVLLEEKNAENLKKEKKAKDLVFINPKISKLSREKAWVPEGCLSVRPLHGQTHRAKKATVTAYDENGKKFTRGGSGLLAQIFQHETEHLDGILFVDHAKDIRKEDFENM